MGEWRGAYREWWVNMRERDHLEVLGVEGRIVLKLVLNNRMRA
jgi:hypothetical protein